MKKLLVSFNSRFSIIKFSQKGCRKMEKILSVSIAAYNVASTLKEVLNPFLNEGVRERVDVMIVNDGSKDDTAQIASEYQKKFPQTFRLISKENGGWGSTLNAGIHAACGKYFKQLDGDDYFSYENLSSYLDYLEKTDSDMVHTPFVTYTDTNGGVLNLLNDFAWQNYSLYPKETVLYLSECPNIRPEMHNLTVKTKLLQNHNIAISEHCFYTDVEYALKAYSICKTVSFYERPIYYYRLAFNGQSMGPLGIRKHYRDNQKMLLSMLDYYKTAISDPWIKSVLFRRLSAVCDLMYRMYFALQCTPKQKQELIEFDRLLKEHYKEFYDSVSTRPVQLLRKTNFNGYWLIAHYKMNKERRLKINFFEGE